MVRGRKNGAKQDLAKKFRICDNFIKEIVLFLEMCPGESPGGILAGWLTGWLAGRLAGKMILEGPGGSGRVRDGPGWSRE